MKTRAKWYTDEDNSTWDRIKTAFRNDWEQTKNDMGVTGTRDIDQDVDDTVKQMAGKQSTARTGPVKFDEAEEAFRYGHAANRHFRADHPEWNDTLRDDLKRDYPNDWDRDEAYIKQAYMHDYSRY